MVVLEREALLGGLDSLLGEAVWHGGRLVLVRGEAGIGKSTLVKSFTSGREGRVLWGACDPVTPPRPLGPIFDMADQGSPGLRQALDAGDRHQVASVFLGLLRAEGGPRIVVIEDAQWADDATLDLLKVVGRRIEQLPALVVVTIREDEVGPDHPLSTTLGDIPPTFMVSVPLPPLSVSAVRQLASGTDIDPVALHATAGGNPFFVAEVLASGGADLPPTVRDAVWARVRRLPEDSREVLLAAAVLGPRCEIDVLSRVAGLPLETVLACVEQGMLRRHDSVVAFPHELAQRAILEAAAGSSRIRLHRRALAVLSERPGTVEPSELAHHALEAGDADAVLELAPRAGAEAARLSAHRAALMHYDHAVPYAARLTPTDRAPLLVAHASECFVAEDLERAVASQREAAACWREAGDVDAQGRTRSELAHYLFWIGQAEEALATASEAVAQLESIPPGPNLAHAYARLAQLMLITGRCSEAIDLGGTAVALAERWDGEADIVHALSTIGGAEVSLGRDEGFDKLQESLRRASTAELEDDISRAFNNLIAGAVQNRRFHLLDRFAADAVAFATERDLDMTRHCLVGDIVEAALRRGRWEEASAQASATIEGGWRSGRFQSLAAFGLLTARRGEPDPFRWLDEALNSVDPGLDDSALCPLRIQRAEAAWLAGDFTLAAAEIELARASLGPHENVWITGEVAYWWWKLDLTQHLPSPVAEPYALLFAGHPQKAAAAWAAVGCPYDEALALAESDDESDLRRSLQLLQGLGAAPAAAMVTTKLRAMGARRISRGPRAPTRANPSGLSNREVDVLVLIADGLRNADIAERLDVSPKTVDHHVSSILRKVGARDRHEAARMAAALDLKG